ncbi:sensor histidine kinase [Candidatus Marinimicrobia bacterium PRS2]|nr:sensor histidine kinase [Candidatus Marinimicrobia bacterium PRS2]
MVIVFTISLTAALYYQFSYSFSTQDSIFDAHENYYYSQMVMGWQNPPDTNLVKQEIENLHMWCGIFEREKNKTDVAYPGKVYWSNLPPEILPKEFYTWTFSSDYESMYDIEIPLEVFFGNINDMPVTVVDNGSYLFYLVIDHIPPSVLNNLIIAFILAIVFIIGLYLFIRRYLKPVQLMKNRIEALEAGDLKSKIDIIGEDELADLSYSMNKLIEDINTLLENKHQLLLEVSHELRSPLARMQLLIAMMPDHKNLTKLKEEVELLEGMIGNLLLSDRLSLPYSKLDLQNFSTQEILEKVMNMFPSTRYRVKIENNIPDERVLIDETKFSLALRNLLDNAFKYSKVKDKPDIELTVIRNGDIEFQVKDSGIGIANEDIKKLTQPFFQANQTVSTKGFGLGLTICKKIIEAHKGRLSIESEPEKGSIFILYLPKI